MLFATRVSRLYVGVNFQCPLKHEFQREGTPMSRQYMEPVGAS
ncbi:hypothetical protein AMC99_01937 [Altererythrobacter epoxidivorans]|uniref:Uncharacterized protein n=1 Tax=Altererythrobacter epoxidivorans TaxID=361183 RepID=A0A0M4MWP8_9SPHN|nr:hypothetical protein AMC99_01937 [Altererythrobacter epoxidivorans]